MPSYIPSKEFRFGQRTPVTKPGDSPELPTSSDEYPRGSSGILHQDTFHVATPVGRVVSLTRAYILNRCLLPHPMLLALRHGELWVSF